VWIEILVENKLAVVLLRKGEITMHIHRWKALLVSAAAAAILWAAPAASVEAEHSHTARLFPPDSQPFGRTYGEWSAAWWRWGASFPTSISPVTNSDAESCVRGQSGPVWFLAEPAPGAPPDRVCTIPEGEALLIPLVNSEWSVAEANANNNVCLVPASPSGTSNQALRACADALTDFVTKVEADFDGRHFEDLRQFRFVSAPFSLTAVPNNPLGIPAGRTRSVADGFFIMLKPPSAGQHTLHVRGDMPSLGLVFEVRYTLTILPR
jgi:hypothetical protein